MPCTSSVCRFLFGLEVFVLSFADRLTPDFEARYLNGDGVGAADRAHQESADRALLQTDDGRSRRAAVGPEQLDGHGFGPVEAAVAHGPADLRRAHDPLEGLLAQPEGAGHI